MAETRLDGRDGQPLLAIIYKKFHNRVPYEKLRAGYEKLIDSGLFYYSIDLTLDLTLDSLKSYGYIQQHNKTIRLTAKGKDIAKRAVGTEIYKLMLPYF